LSQERMVTMDLAHHLQDLRSDPSGVRSGPARRRRPRRVPTDKRRTGFRPELETAEDRCLLSAGAPDPSFGVNGIVTTAFPNNTNDGALAVAIYPSAGTPNDGKIIAAGDSRSTTNTLLQDFALARYNPDSSPDNSFDGDGKVVTDVSGIGKEDAAFAVAIQADGKIVAAGFARRPSHDTDIAVVRYNVNGSLDPTFGTKGIVFTDLNKGDDDAFSMVIQP